MIWMRGALVGLAATLVLSCARGRPQPAGRGAAPGGTSGAAATGTAPLAASQCPRADRPLAAPDPRRVIDDFATGGPLDGRVRAGEAFVVTEQFLSTPAARFEPPPAVDGACGAAAPGAAHIKGTAADTGATYSMVLATTGTSTSKPAAFYDASASGGVTFRAALGNARAAKTFTVRLGVAGSPWAYTKDLVVDGPAWKTFEVRWADLDAASGAPPFSPSALAQIVFPFASGAPVDLFLDDVALLGHTR
jgi:hypothetical protein